MASQKSVSKSIRLTPELFDYINHYRGDGFNEKFENIILDAKLSEQERISSLERLDKEIKQRKDFLADIDTRLTELQTLLRRTTGGRW